MSYSNLDGNDICNTANPIDNYSGNFFNDIRENIDEHCQNKDFLIENVNNLGVGNEVDSNTIANIQNSISDIENNYDKIINDTSYKGNNYTNVLDTANKLQKSKLEFMIDNIKKVERNISENHYTFNRYYSKKYLYRYITELCLYFLLGCIVILAIVFMIFIYYKKP